MNPKVYSEAELRELIECFTHPLVLTRFGKLLAVNQAVVNLFGYSKERIEGRPFGDFVPAEDRRRLTDRDAKSREKTGPANTEQLQALAYGPDGKLLNLDVVPNIFPADDGGEPFAAVSIFKIEEKQRQLDLSQLLVEISASLVGRLTEGEVCVSGAAEFARAGMSACFLLAEEGKVEPVHGLECKVVGVDPAYALEAIEASRPVFGGPMAAQPTHAYVPVPRGALPPWVLVIHGPERLRSEHTATLNLFAKLLASALEDARKNEEARRRLSESQLLLELARLTSSTLELSTILDLASDFLVRFLDVTDGFIWLYDAKEQYLQGFGASVGPRPHFASIRIPLADPTSLAARVVRQRSAIVIPDVEKEPGSARADLVEKFKDRALVGLPLIAREQVVGVVVLGDKRGPRVFSSEWVELAQAATAHLALSMANARLYESLKESYAELAQARAEMVHRERLAALGELAAIVAHEVRNPLGVIVNAAASLERMVPRGDDTRMLFEIVGQESERLNQIVGDLIDFAKPRELSLQEEDVGAVIQEAIETASRVPRPRGKAIVTFEKEVAPGLPQVPMDRRLVRQALVNVAVNAVQAMPRGGRVKVRAERDGDSERGFLRVDISDEGPGIPEETLARVFEPFFTTKAKGTGLGLALVKRIVEEHRGKVEVRSEEGKGTTFTFRLPITASVVREAR